MKNTLLILFGLVVIGGTVWFFMAGGEDAEEPAPEPAPATMAEACEENGGSWNNEVGDCETTNDEWCVAEGGVYTECASACRTETSTQAPPETVCTLQCVPVCRF